ncbi:MAG: serine/threonine-protein kinase [Pyrinomonadaceae bacterium]
MAAMTGLEHYVGQVLDDKYRLERLLGQGGMGAVYLATHLGTERYVALKLIAPQFMRNEEFVERFKREARAAGRLRHPNVVDVTDFGFAEAGDKPVAYLIMEYLDGCTLGDVLKEEKRLPLEWVVDILEQVCSAVHEAHQQGIVHRDLKPDNIWLEPNRLGSYRVKVLDFGIAKLGEIGTATAGLPSTPASTQPRSSGAQSGGARGFSAAASPAVAAPAKNASADLESETLLYRSGDGDGGFGKNAETSTPARPENTGVTDTNDTKLFAQSTENEPLASPGLPAARHAAPHAHLISANVADDRTLKFDQLTRPVPMGARTTLAPDTVHGTELTRVGAIMGTPLYMSPEQCSGKSLDSRSDTYSLGVIAYQMLVGEPPFAGDTSTILRGHMETPPAPLREQNKKVPKRLADLVMSALAKDPADRPQSSAAFASALRAQSESIGSLYRRAFSLYSEHFPKFLKLSLIAHVPVIITTGLLIALELAENSLPKGLSVTKVLTVTALILMALLQVVAYFVAASVISGVTTVIITQLAVAPLRPVELRPAFAVLKRRWRPFFSTAVRVTLRIIGGIFLGVIPGLVMIVRYAFYAPVVLMEGLERKAALRRSRELGSRSWRTVIIVVMLQFLIPAVASAVMGRIFGNAGVRISIGEGNARAGAVTTGPANQIYQQLLSLINIVIVPLMSIVPALLYLKMRRLGGESLNATLAKLDEADGRRSQWQQRMRSGSSLHTPRSLIPPSGP